MAWKRLTHNKVNYFVNLEEVAYLRVVNESTTKIVFAALGGDSNQLSIIVNQSPDEILKGEDLH
jgi:hypothetical protein